MVKDPFKKWDRVDTFCTLLVGLGRFVTYHQCWTNLPHVFSHDTTGTHTNTHTNTHTHKIIGSLSLRKKNPDISHVPNIPLVNHLICLYIL